MKENDIQQLKDLTARCTKGQKDSACFLQLFNDVMVDDPSSDPVPVIQLGYACLLDKPIIIVAPLGAKVPVNIKRLARAVEFYDPTNMESCKEAPFRALNAAGLSELQHE